MTRVRVGLVGAGFSAAIHLRAYARLPETLARVAAITAVPREQAERSAREYSIPHVCDDLASLLRRDDVDLVDLCVPNHLHVEFVMAAARAGKHIICEKPLTGYFGADGGRADPRQMLSVALSSADAMLATAAAHGVRLMYAENWLYAPAIRRARELAAASQATIMEMRAQECHSGSHAAYAKQWSLCGGGALVRLGSHPLAAALHLKATEGLRRDGRPIGVRSVVAEVADLTKVASFQREPKPWLVTGWEDVENWGTMLLTFADGTRATIYAADTVLGGMEDTLDIFMSNCRLHCDLTHNTMLRAYAPSPEVFAGEYLTEKLETKAGWSFPSVDEEWMLGYPQEIQDFMEAVALDRPALADGQLGREVVRVLYSAYVSAAEGRRIDLDQR